MNLAIFHYHLNRGGVTQVIANQLLALDAVLEAAQPWRVALIYGGRRKGWAEDLPQRLANVRLSMHPVAQLDYDPVRTAATGSSPPELHGRLRAVLEDLQFTPRRTVLHLHNHSLGKNRCLGPTVGRLADDGYALLLQIHDFAEDFRPANYRQIVDPALLYPQAANVHYAVLNGRDHDVLLDAGVDGGRLHLLPNPVTRIDGLPQRSDARRRLAEQFDVGSDRQFVLYPVRCIRRKNVGEVLLYSALAPPPAVFGLTLAPLNPAEHSVYTMWKELAAELDLPCLFEVGAAGALSFAENLAAADLILTTSLAEGFGMVFLESWLASRPLVGRDLPEITADFARWGVRFEWLRPTLNVPLDWIGRETFCRMVAEAYRRTLVAYDHPQPPRLDEEMLGRTQTGLVDFGQLDETLQQQVIRTVRGSQENRRRVIQSNPWLDDVFSIRPEVASKVIRHNSRAIVDQFSLPPSGRRLLKLYGQLEASPRGQGCQPLDGAGRILDYFLELDRFRLIRT